MIGRLGARDRGRGRLTFPETPNTTLTYPF
jgi:hypothetical protein